MSDVEQQDREPGRDAGADAGTMAGTVPAAAAVPGVARGGTPGADGIRVPESGARVCEVTLDEFEGPLDLLLHLVRRHELDILDIPIAFVCEKYLEYIEFMRALDLEVAGDYLVMAATLAYLKSRELVPQQDVLTEEVGEDGEIGGDPRQQLILRLLEYQKYKEAADRLDARPISGRDTFGRGGVVELPPVVDAGLAPITLFRLAEAYQRVLDRARIHKSHEVVMETISVAARMEQLTAILIERSSFDFEKLFLERSWSSESELRGLLVVTLMSILELVRMGIASVYQPIGVDTILVERVASADAAREALRGYDESLSFGDGKPAGEAPPIEDEPDEDDALDWETLLGGAAEDPEDEDAAQPGALLEDAPEEAVEASTEAEGLAASLDLDEEAEDEDVGASTDTDELAASLDEEAEDEAVEASTDTDELAASLDDEGPEDVAAEGFASMHDAPPEADEALPEAVLEADARVTEPATPGDDAPEAAAASAAAGGPNPDDAGAHARSVVSESPPSPGAVVDAAGEVAPAPTVDGGASESTEGDGQQDGENGEAEAVEGS